MDESARKIDIKALEHQKNTLNYLNWNNKIAEYFFNSNNAGKRIWLTVERDLVEKIARQNKTNFESFINTLKKGPDEINRPKQTICSKAHAIFENWRDKRNIQYPPYIAYLSLFVLAVNHGDSDDFSENNYYGRLSDLVSETLSTNNFKHIPDLWDDLEKWSLEDKQGNFGEFHTDIVGKKFYVGIPSYQVVLRSDDKKNLPEIFWKMGWNSDSNPTEQEILQALKSNQNLLSNTTLRRIEKRNDDFLHILTNRILEELRDYDEDENLLNNENREVSNRGSIEICLNVNSLIRKAECSFRCKRKSGLPDEQFLLNSKWEVPLSLPSISGKIEKFNIENWEKDFQAQAGKYKFRYKGEKYKIFTKADKLGISGWISGQKCTSDKFYLAVHNSLSDKVKNWGKLECNKCEKLDFEGFPSNWDLFNIQGVKGNERIRRCIPALAIDKTLRIKFDGGIRSSRGNTFFYFAPPAIVITGRVDSNLIPYYSKDNQNKNPLTLSQIEKNTFYLPKIVLSNKEKTPYDESIIIEICQNGLNNGSKKKLNFCEHRLKKFTEYLDYGMDQFGDSKPIQQENNDKSHITTVDSYFKGAYCHHLNNIIDFPRLPFLSLDEMKKTYLVGNIPGQIIRWPKESLLESWSPIWTIQFKTWKKATADLVGDFKGSDQMQNGTQNYSKEKIKLWKKIVWNYRKRIKSKYTNQWKIWTEGARNV